MPFPTPTPAATPTPSSEAKKAPEPPPTFAGKARIVVYGDVIATGESKAVRGFDLDRVESALKRVPGVTEVRFDPEGRAVNVGFAGTFADLRKLEFAVTATGASAELVSPAKVLFRPSVSVEDASKVIASVRGIGGVQFVTRENNDFVVYCDLRLTTLDSIRTACESVGIKGSFASHEEVRLALTGSGDASALLDDLLKTKWVLGVAIEGGTLKVLATKGRVSKALLKSITGNHGYK